MTTPPPDEYVNEALRFFLAEAAELHGGLQTGELTAYGEVLVVGHHWYFTVRGRPFLTIDRDTVYAEANRRAIAARGH